MTAEPAAGRPDERSPAGAPAARPAALAGSVLGATNATGAPSTPCPPPARGSLPRLRRRLATARALWRDFTGESAYDRYVERHRREHPDHEPMTARQWWRAKADEDEKHVQPRCC